jgi:hypothetical protein
MEPQLSRPEFAHYYGDWMWRVELTDWVKSLLLFFDGLALALPSETAMRLIDADPILAQPLFERNLLHNYEPTQWFKFPTGQSDEVEREFFERVYPLLNDPQGLSEASLYYLDGFFMGVDTSDPDIYMLRLEAMWEHVKSLGGQFGEDDYLVVSLAVGIISKLLHEHINDAAIQPVINDENAASFVDALIGPQAGNRAKIIVSDLAHIGLDLSIVPLDEVLEFRREHGSEYRDYSREIRQFALDLSLMPEAERSTATAERRSELDDRAADLRRTGRSAFGRELVTLSFGIAGAAWTLRTGDIWGAAFAAGAAAAGLSKPNPTPMGAAYSYILRAKDEFAR